MAHEPEIDFNFDYCEVTRFFPYSHIVTERILHMDYDWENYECWMKDLVNKYNDTHINQINTGNKIAFECNLGGKIFYVGFYDGIVLLGFGVRKIS